MTKKSIIPNTRFITSLRSLGYTNHDAVADLTDNCIDAGAKNIHIKVSENKVHPIINENEVIPVIIEITDDGCGMNESTLFEMLKLGSNSEKNHLSDLGRFGTGANSASISIAKKFTVITKETDSNYFTGIFDIDAILKSDSWDADIRKSTNMEIEYFDKSNYKSGTIVILSKCDMFQSKDIQHFIKKLKSNIQKTFNKFINSGICFYINTSEKLQSHDPIYWDDDTYKDYKYEDESEVLPGKFIKYKFNVIGSKEGKAEDERFNKGQGFYVYRNNRLIVHGETLGVYHSSPHLRRLRIEISFDGTLDEYFGINLQKQTLVLKQFLSDKLRVIFNDRINNVSKKFINDGTKEKSKGLDEIFKNVGARIQKDQNLLTLPKIQTQVIDSGEVYRCISGVKKNKSTDHEFPEKNQSPFKPIKGKKGYFAKTEFLIKNAGKTAPIYEASIVGDTMYITINSDHLFYQKFIVNPCDDKNRAASMASYLVASMAISELLESNEDNCKVLENARIYTSRNLQELLQ